MLQNDSFSQNDQLNLYNINPNQRMHFQPSHHNSQTQRPMESSSSLSTGPNMELPPLPNLQKTSKHDVYYEGNKKNELNELKAYFKNTLSNPNLAYFKKQAIKKIILYTTSGVDTSRLYPEMVIASATKDIVEKKMIFHYLTIYSQKNHNFARMAVNTFMKDSNSNDPAIRALAIKHLSNLRYKGREQYLMPILKKGLQDYSTSVKKACIMGITKLITDQNRMKQQPSRDEDLLNLFYGMIRDSNPDIIVCLVEAINEIQPEGIAMSKKLTHYLVQNIKIFNGYQLPSILNYVELYDPKSEQETIQFLEILQNRVHSQNSALVLSISKIFLKYGSAYPRLMDKIQLIIKPCLLAFINDPLPEIQYPVLKHIIYIIKSYQLQSYVESVKKFYVSDDNPTYIKKAKIQLLALNCRSSNFSDIVNQLTEYMIDPNIIKQVMQAFSHILLKSDDLIQCKTIIKTLCDLIINLKDQYEHLCDYSILVIRTFLRKFPDEFNILQNSFYQLVKGIKLKESRCAMLEIIGEYGEKIEDAIQLIVWSENSIDDEVKISLLRANIKLFFKRPIQMLNIVNNLFRSIIQDEQTRLPVRDYAAMLYRAMQADMGGFKKVFLAQRQFDSEKQALFEADLQQKLKQFQFNSLEVTYDKNKSSWLIDKTKYIELLDQIQYSEQPDDTEIDPLIELEKKRSAVVFSDEYHQIDPDDINPDYEMPAQQFEKYWDQFEVGASITRIIKQIDLISEQTLEELFRMWHISVIASAQNEESIKQYLYMKLYHKNEIACMEFEVMKEVETLTLVVKCQNEQLAGFVSRYIEDFIKLNDII